MIGLGEGAAAGATEGAERITLFLGKGEVPGGHQEIGIVIDRFKRITTTGEFRDVMKLDIQPIGHLSGREFVIGSPDRDRATQEKGIMNFRRTIFLPFLHDEAPAFPRSF